MSEATDIARRLFGSPPVAVDPAEADRTAKVAPYKKESTDPHEKESSEADAGSHMAAVFGTQYAEAKRERDLALLRAFHPPDKDAA